MPLIYNAWLNAKALGVPPWVAMGEEPTPAVIALWVRRIRIFRSMEM